MITVKNSTREFHGGANCFVINDKIITLSFKASEYLIVQRIANEIWDALKNLDIEAFRKIQRKYKDAHVLKISTAFEIEYENMIRLICNQFLENKTPITASDVFKQLGFPSPKQNRPEYMFVYEKVDMILQEYFQKLLESVKSNNIELVWSYATAIRKRILGTDVVLSCISLGKAFEDYLEKCVEELEKINPSLGWLQLFNYSLYGSLRARSLPTVSIVKHFKNNEYNPFKKARHENYLKQMEHIKNKKYRFDDELWTVYTIQIEYLHKHTFEFNDLQGEVKKHIKQYINYLLGAKENPKKVSERLRYIKLCLEVLKPYQIISLWDLNTAHVHYLINKLQEIKTKQASEKKYGLRTINGCFSIMKVFYEWLIEKYEKDKENPFTKFSFHNVKSFSKKISYIPEEVIHQLETHLDELPDRVKSAWVIMMHSGMRISEAVTLEEDWLYYDDEQKTWMLKYVPWKTVKYRKDKFHVIPAHEELMKYFRLQSENTRELRERLNTKLIFCSEQFNRGTITSKTRINVLINNLIEKYQIRDNFGKLFHYSHHQCRKTVTTSLFSEGATLEEVANFVGHINLKTTEETYKDIQIDKLAQLESDFLKSILMILLSQKSLTHIQSWNAKLYFKK